MKCRVLQYMCIIRKFALTNDFKIFGIRVLYDIILSDDVGTLRGNVMNGLNRVYVFDDYN